MERQWQLLPTLLTAVALVLFSGCQLTPPVIKASRGSQMKVHYIEIVAKNVDKQCKALEQLHGASFGPEVDDLGRARVSETVSGVMIGVRAPMAEHEQPIIRTYFAVDDIGKAIKAAEASGAMIAYPPTKQGETGTWAIYILDDMQIGLWQQ